MTNINQQQYYNQQELDQRQQQPSPEIQRESANDKVRREAEEQQNRKIGTEAMTPTQQRLNQALNSGAKIAAIKQAFYEEEKDKLLIERERDDNLVAYLEMREQKLRLEGENRILRQTVRENDLNKINQIEYARQQRDEQFTQSKAQTELQDLSRKNFEKLLESRRGYKIGKN